MIDGSEKRNRQLPFELQNSHVCEKRSNGNFQGLLEVIIKITIFVELSKCLHSFSSAMHCVSAF